MTESQMEEVAVAFLVGLIAEGDEFEAGDGVRYTVERVERTGDHIDMQLRGAPEIGMVEFTTVLA